jgi:threonine/homoserine/homoserine lactone efflux protein
MSMGAYRTMLEYLAAALVATLSLSATYLYVHDKMRPRPGREAWIWVAGLAAVGLNVVFLLLIGLMLMAAAVSTISGTIPWGGSP